MMRTLGGVSHFDSLCRGGGVIQDLRGKIVTLVSLASFQHPGASPLLARP